MPPLSEIGLHDDASCSGIGQHFAGVFRAASATKHVAIGAFGILHAESPESGRRIGFLEEDGADKGDFAIHADVPLAFNAEADKPVARQFCHDIA